MGDKLSPDPTEGAGLKAAAAVFLAALALRAAFLLLWPSLPYASAFSADAWVHDNWALEILREGLLRRTAFYQSPFYPYFLAACYKLFGHAQAPVFWLQAFADAAGCVLIMRAAALCFGGGAGLAAGLLAAAYRPFIFSTGLLAKETFSVFAQSLTLLLLLRAGRAGRARDHLLWGLALGWGAISRPNSLLMLPGALLWLRLLSGGAESARTFLRRAILPSAAGVMLLISPVTLHNWLAARDFVPFNYVAGFVLYLGNHAGASGTTTYPEGISSDPLAEEAEISAIAEKAAGRKLKPSEISSWWAAKALAFIREDPGAAVRLTVKKAFLFWNRYEVPDNYDLGFVSRNFDTVLGWPLANFALAGTLGAFGLFLCRFRENSGAVALLFWPHFLSLLPFLITDRYRLPPAALLLVAAGGALARLAAAWREKKAAGLLRPALLALPFALVCLAPPPFDLRFNEAAGWGQLAALESDRGEHAAALEAFRRAFETAPEAISEAAVSAAAASLQALGEPGPALGLYERWTRVYPSSALLYNNKGALLYSLGRYRESAEALETSLRLDPAPRAQYKGLFYAYVKLKDRRKACEHGLKAAELHPGDPALKAAAAALRSGCRR